MTDMDHDEVPSSAEPTPKPASLFLAHLWQLCAEAEPNTEWRRASHRRKNCGGVRLELQRQNGAVFNVRLHNVSTTGICVICPKKIRQADVVKLRCKGGPFPEEDFTVVHVTSTIGGFKLGLSLLRD